MCVQVELRSHDILELIAIARAWYDNGKPFRGLPAAVGHVSCSLRLVVVYEAPSQSLEVLLNTEKEKEGVSHLPVCLINRKRGGSINNDIKTTLEVKYNSSLAKKLTNTYNNYIHDGGIGLYYLHAGLGLQESV